MRLFTLDDLVIFGTGSEWLWNMLTTIALPVTFVAIYLQIRAQRGANAFEQVQALFDEWSSERMRYARLRLALGLRHGTEPEDGIEALTGRLDAFFTKLEYLHHEGYLDAEILRRYFGEDVVRWWTVIPGVVERVRLAYGSPGEYADWERLAREMREAMARDGVPPFETDAASVLGRLDWIISGERYVLGFERDFKAGSLPEPPVAAPAS